MKTYITKWCAHKYPRLIIDESSSSWNGIQHVAQCSYGFVRNCISLVNKGEGRVRAKQHNVKRKSKYFKHQISYIMAIWRLTKLKTKKQDYNCGYDRTWPTLLSSSIWLVLMQPDNAVSPEIPVLYINLIRPFISPRCTQFRIMYPKAARCNDLLYIGC